MQNTRAPRAGEEGGKKNRPRIIRPSIDRAQLASRPSFYHFSIAISRPDFRRIFIPFRLENAIVEEGLGKKSITREFGKIDRSPA